jgi:hypothetical protein
LPSSRSWTHPLFGTFSTQKKFIFLRQPLARAEWPWETTVELVNACSRMMDLLDAPMQEVVKVMFCAKWKAYLSAYKLRSHARTALGNRLFITETVSFGLQ